TVKDGNNRTSRYAYDGAGQTTVSQSVPTSGTTYTANSTYNDADLLSSTVAPSGTGFSALGSTSRTYDAGGRLSQQTDGNGDTEQLTYAGDGSLGERVVSQGFNTVSDFQRGVDGDYRVTFSGCITCPPIPGNASYVW